MAGLSVYACQRGKPRSGVSSILLVPTRAQRINARGTVDSAVARVIGIRGHTSSLAPAQRASWMPALICFSRVEQCVFVFLLVAAMLGVPVNRIRRVAAVCGFNLGGPGSVLGVVVGRVAGSVVGILRRRLVWHDAFAKELVQVVAGYARGDGKEEAEEVVLVSL